MKGPFICDICNKECKNPQALIGHKKYKHTEQFAVAPPTPPREEILSLTEKQVEQIVAKGLLQLQQKISDLEAQLVEINSSAECDSEINRGRRKAIGRAIKMLSDRMPKGGTEPAPPGSKLPAYWPFPMDKL